MQAEQLIQEGRLADALSELQAEVRSRPAEPKLRVFLYQMLCVLGDWDRALTQLNVAAEMDAANLLMAQVGREALQCEALRARVFAGQRTPLVLGEPPDWLGRMVRANQLTAEGHDRQSQEVRAEALEQAPAIPGRINDQDFEWVADADTRLGPVIEAIIDGRYYWVPFTYVRRLEIEEPTDLRDLVWSPARFLWTNGGEKFGLIPTRYPGSEASEDEGIRMARKTEWLQREGGVFLGLGQRMWATDKAEYPILETRTIELDHEDRPEGRPPPQEA